MQKGQDAFSVFELLLHDRYRRKKMQTILITGAAQGIGLATAKLFAERGWRVLGVDDNASKLKISADKASFEPIVCDLSDAAAIERTVLTRGHINALVNNAATSAPADPRMLDLSAWERVLAVNLTAPFLLSRLLADKLIAGKGSIVNIASTRALMSEPSTEAYSASKGGLLSLTHAMAMSLSPVRVNAVSPGWIEHVTPEALSYADHAFHPVGRVGIPEDVAEMIWYLVSDTAGFITGQNFVVDGGVTRKMIYPE
jgi:NAD(P)-dependent dehydrogenase (short-subunit alcohol dehydrogenase family)